MKVLFIGGTGLISEAVTKLAVEQGIDLYVFNRGERQQFVPAGANVLIGDVRDKESVRKAIEGHHFDVVVNWIAFTADHVLQDIELFSGRVGQYIFISSASAYQKPVSHYLVTESTPLANPFWAYSRDKIACERVLMDEYRANGFPVTIVRPSFTYGNTMIPAALNSWAMPWSLVDRMRSGKPIIVHGDGTSLWTMTHNSDFAKGFVGLLGHMQAVGHAFHITSDEVLTWDQIYTAIGRAAGVEPNLVHISSEFICRLHPEETGGLFGDKAVSVVFDNSKIKRFVPGFQATIPFAEGIRRSVSWLEQRPELCKVDAEWNDKIDRIISAHSQ